MTSETTMTSVISRCTIRCTPARSCPYSCERVLHVKSRLSCFDDAEVVPFRIREDHVVATGLSISDDGRAEREQALDFRGLIARIQIEVQPDLAGDRLLLSVHRHVRASAGGIL